MSLADRAKAHYRDNLHEPVAIRRITGTGSSRTDATYATVGRVWKATRKDLVGGFAQQDMQAIIYAQALFDNGLPSDVIKGDFLIDQDGIEYSVEDVEFRRVEAIMVGYELKIRG